MTDLRGRTFFDLLAGLNAGQHLAVDAIVAFVDGELGPAAHSRATAHLATCHSCAAEVAAQRQARSVVRSAEGPQVPAGLLAALRAIPDTAELPAAPDGLAVTAEGTIVALADPDRGPAAAPLDSTAPLGAGPRWGTGSSILGRRAGRTGAGAVVSGLVFGALVMSMFENPVAGSAGPQPERQPPPVLPSALPAAAPAGDPGAITAQEVALLRTTAQPGWYGVRAPR
jgi:anti-sigma factor RsiW